MRLILLLLLAGRLFAGAPALSKGFDHFYNLEYDQAIAEFEKDVRDHPQDPFSYTHLAQGLLYREMFQAGAMETELVTGSNFSISKARVLASAAEQKHFDDTVAKAISLSEARIAVNPKDTEAIYALGAAHGLQSNYNFLVRKLWRDSLKEFTLSRKYHQQVLQIDPNFVDAMLVCGVHDYVVGSLPWHWKMLGFLIGFRGDKDGGLRTVERVAAEGQRNRVDAMILLAVAYRRERHAEKAVPLLLQLISQFPRNYLIRLEIVQMYADLGRKDDALAVLKKMEELKTAGAPGFKQMPAGKIYHSRGNLLFWYREYQEAIVNLNKAVKSGPDAGANTLVNAWLRLGQSHDMLGQRQEALQAYRQAVQDGPDSDAGHEAKKYLSSPYKR